MQDYAPPRASVQQVLLKHDQHVSSSAHVQKVLQRLRTCRTAALGYHLYRCSNEDCSHLKYQYHSCRDRHCPQCGALKKQEWIEARTAELLPVKYYHVVFTLPHELNSMVMGNRRILYKLLFDASSQTLLRFAADPKYLQALPGIISVLHTWGQQLSFHPHIHCIVSGGGITVNGTWKQATKNDWSFLFPVKAMSKTFRGKFLETLQYLIANGTVVLAPGADHKHLFNLLYQKDWIVYAKAPFGGPQAVNGYLGRYTHKVAISNHRITSFNQEDDKVNFDYKDYSDDNKQKQMALSGQEFIRRFEQHILPRRFTKIRTYGYLSNRNRQQRINEVLKKMKLPLHKERVNVPVQVRMIELYGIDILECPCCKSKSMQLLQVYYPWKHADDG
jgi:hypothetical protein